MQRVFMSAAAILSLFAMLFLLFGGKLLLPLFVKDGDVALHDMSLRAMRFYALSYLVSWVQMTLAGYLTALEKPWHSLAISLLGTFVFPLVFLAILVPLWQLDGVWVLNFVSSVFSAIVAVVIAKKALKTIRS